MSVDRSSSAKAKGIGIDHVVKQLVLHYFTRVCGFAVRLVERTR